MHAGPVLSLAHAGDDGVNEKLLWAFASPFGPARVPRTALHAGGTAMRRSRNAGLLLLACLMMVTACGASHGGSDPGAHDGAAMDADGGCCGSDSGRPDSMARDSGPPGDGGVPSFTWQPGPTLPAGRLRVNRTVTVASNGSVVNFCGHDLGTASPWLDFWTTGLSDWTIVAAPDD